jgi:large subunit ribosomal protein L32
MSAQKRDQRRANWKFTPVAVATCPKCNEPKAPHQVCPACGQYNGRQVTAAKA